VGGRTSETWIGIEATPCPQTDEDLARRTALQSLLDLDGIVAGVENEQGSGTLLRRPAEERFHLLGGHLVGVLRGSDALHVHRGGPALADEVEPGDELVGPARYDGLAGRVSGGMIVETTLGAALRVAAGPHAYVHGVDGRFASSSSWKRMASEQPPQSFGVDPSTAQRVVETAPAPAVRRLQAQVDWRRDRLRCEDGVGEFEEGVRTAMEAVVE